VGIKAIASKWARGKAVRAQEASAWSPFPFGLPTRLLAFAGGEVSIWSLS